MDLPVVAFLPKSAAAEKRYSLILRLNHKTVEPGVMIHFGDKINKLNKSLRTPVLNAKVEQFVYAVTVRGVFFL